MLTVVAIFCGSTASGGWWTFPLTRLCFLPFCTMIIVLKLQFPVNQVQWCKSLSCFHCLNNTHQHHVSLVIETAVLYHCLCSIHSFIRYRCTLLCHNVNAVHPIRLRWCYSAQQISTKTDRFHITMAILRNKVNDGLFYIQTGVFGSVSRAASKTQSRATKSFRHGADALRSRWRKIDNQVESWKMRVTKDLCVLQGHTHEYLYWKLQ